MTVENVRARVAGIAAQRDDDEMAHIAEDELHQDVLRAIAEGAPDARALAEAALETQALDFSRWCA